MEDAGLQQRMFVCLVPGPDNERPNERTNGDETCVYVTAVRARPRVLWWTPRPFLRFRERGLYETEERFAVKRDDLEERGRESGRGGWFLLQRRNGPTNVVLVASRGTPRLRARGSGEWRALLGCSCGVGIGIGSVRARVLLFSLMSG